MKFGPGRGNDAKQVGIFFVDGTSYNVLGAGTVTKFLKDLEIKK